MSRIKRMRRTTETGADRRGVALVELALLLPLFVMLVLGIVEFGRALSVSQLLTTAAREGARLATMPGSSNMEVTSSVKQSVSSALNIPSEQVDVRIAITPAPGSTIVAADVGDAQIRDLCEVTVEVAFQDVAYVTPRYLAGKKLTSHCAMRK